MLIYSHVPLWDVQHVGMIELAWRHSTSGDEVTILSCEGDLGSCPANPHHKKNLCTICKVQSKVSHSLYLPKESQNVRLELRPGKLVLVDFETLEEFRDYKFGRLPAGKLALSQLVTDLRDCHVALEDLNGRGKELITNAVALYLESKRLLSRGHFDKVYVWNGRRDSDGPLLIAAQELGIPSFAYISGGSPDRLYLSESTLHSFKVFREEVLRFQQRFSGHTGKKFLRSQAELFFQEIRTGRSHIPGRAWFGESFKPSSTGIFPRTTKSKLAIFSSSLWETINFPEWQNADPTLKNTYSLLESIASDPEILDRYDIVIRWHPNLRTAGENELRLLQETVRNTPRVKHVLPGDSADSYELIDEADLILTTGSTISIEAAYLGKPTIVAGPAIFDELGSTYSAKNSQELRELLFQNLDALPDNGAVMYGAWHRNYGERNRFVTYNRESKTFTVDGKKIKIVARLRERFMSNLSRSRLGRLLVAVRHFVLRGSFRFAESSKS